MSKKEKEKLIKEYCKKYPHLERQTVEEWKHASKEADEKID